MKKIVINRCFGGFSLSPKAMKELINLGYTEEYWDDEDSNFGGYGSREKAIKSAIEYGYIECERDDPRLIKVIERLGSKKASGRAAELKIVEIPDDVEWEIDEYDGLETIHEKHRTWS